MPAPKAAAPFAPVLPLPLTCVPPAALSPPRATLSEKVQFTMMAGLLPGDGLLKTAAPEANPEVRLRELREEMFKLRFQFATRQLTNTARIREVRRDIARVLTLQHQQELTAARAGR